MDTIKLPTFLVIGAMKAGTTSLWNYLRLHPNIFMPDLKETNFFVNERNWKRGLDWYLGLFTPCGKSVKAIGEASTSYTKYPAFSGVPSRIASVLPNVRLIYVVRDPIERIQSMYIHLVLKGYEKRDFANALKDLKNNHYIEVSSYYLQITQYLHFFPIESIFVIASEDLKNKRHDVLKKVFRFIGVVDDFVHPSFEVLNNQTQRLRKINRLGAISQALPNSRVILSRLPRPFREVYSNIATSSIHKPEITLELKERLIESLQPDINNFRSLVGQDFPHWML